MNNLLLVILIGLGFFVVVGGIVYAVICYLKRALKPLLSIIDGEISFSLFDIAAILKGRWRDKRVEIRATSHSSDCAISIKFYHFFPFSCQIFPDKNKKFIVCLPPLGFLGYENEIPEDKLDISSSPYKDFFTQRRRESIRFVFEKGFNYINISHNRIETRMGSWSMIPLVGREKETLQIDSINKLLEAMNSFVESPRA